MGWWLLTSGRGKTLLRRRVGGAGLVSHVIHGVSRRLWAVVEYHGRQCSGQVTRQAIEQLNTNIQDYTYRTNSLTGVEPRRRDQIYKKAPRNRKDGKRTPDYLRSSRRENEPAVTWAGFRIISGRDDGLLFSKSPKIIL